jgi:hypothetical protein
VGRRRFSVLVPLALVGVALIFGARAGAETIMGVIDGSEPTRANVPFDNNVPSVCPGMKSYPGSLPQPGTHYDAYARSNAGGPQCLKVTLALDAGGSTDCALNPNAKCAFSEVYSSLNPSDASSGYLGDIGTPVAPGSSRIYNVLIPAGSPYTVVVDEYYPGVGTTNYTLTLELNAPTAVALRSLSARRTHAGALIRWSVGSAAGSVGFRVFRLTGSSRARVNTDLIPVKTGLSSSYSLVDRKAPAARRIRYEIDAVGLAGNRTLLGITTLSRA